MAFRTELDAMRARAEAAEAKLAETEKRLVRSDHADARLEAARALAREAAVLAPRVFSPRWLGVGIAIGALVALGLAAAWARVEADAWREAVEVERVRADEAASRLAEARVSTVRVRAEPVELVSRPIGGGPQLFGQPLGTVTSSLGPAAPVPAGAFCTLERARAIDCFAEIRCGGVPVHSLACVVPPSTEMSEDDGEILVFSSAVDWTVRIRRGRDRPGSTGPGSDAPGPPHPTDP